MTIYQILDEKDIIDVPDHDKYKILDLLKSNPGKLYTAATIANICGYPEKDPTRPEVRKAITMLWMEQVPIIATNRGFFYSEKMEDIEEYKESLEHRRDGLTRRIDAVILTLEKFKVNSNRNL